MNGHLRLLSGLLFSFGLFVGCGDDDVESGTPDDPNTACVETNEACGPDNCSGEGDLMLPGSNCISCHSEGNMPEDDEPKNWYTIAGTVFKDINGTAGASGVTIRVTDSVGTVVELKASAVGNFYSRTQLQAPLTAEIESGGEKKVMIAEVQTGDCASCHKCGGVAGGKLFGP